MADSIEQLTTEQRNPATTHIDTMSTPAMVAALNHENDAVVAAVAAIAAPTAAAIDAASARYNRGGRLLYCGAGTSGRLGVLDAAELVPTYGIDPKRAIGLIAGGHGAMFAAVEGAEDDQALGTADLDALGVNANDTVIGIAASGRTPYVLGALARAKKAGALTIAVACVTPSAIGQAADFALEAVVGPEPITGSTRMKAGTAQKILLNTLSTGVMIKAGKVYQNLMVDVLPTNAKLVDRAQRIIATTTGVSLTQAQAALTASGNKVPVAIVVAQTGMSPAAAAALLAAHHGVISAVLADWRRDHDR